METVFSDPDGTKVAFLREARSQGYVVFLVFIGLSSGDLAIARVVQRTEAGGHDVPDEKITARFPRTFDNLRQAITFVDHALLFDNSSADEPYRFIAEFAGAKVVRQGSYRCAWAAAAEPEASKLSRAAECDTVSTAENPFVFDWKLGAGDPT